MFLLSAVTGSITTSVYCYVVGTFMVITDDVDYCGLTITSFIIQTALTITFYYSRFVLDWHIIPVTALLYCHRVDNPI